MSKYIELPIIIEWDDKDEADRTADGDDAFSAGVLFARGQNRGIGDLNG